MVDLPAKINIYTLCLLYTSVFLSYNPSFLYEISINIHLTDIIDNNRKLNTLSLIHILIVCSSLNAMDYVSAVKCQAV